MSLRGDARIRDLFSTARPIDRPIEKVIDYAASDGQRLLREVQGLRSRRTSSRISASSWTPLGRACTPGR